MTSGTSTEGEGCDHYDLFATTPREHQSNLIKSCYATIKHAELLLAESRSFPSG